MNNEIIESYTIDFKPAELPQIISKQVDKMKVLESNINNVVIDAEKAKKAAQDANKEITFFNGRKEAIEELQSSGKTLASAIQKITEALQLFFEFQKELTEISKFLLALGASNIAQNRLVVRELELKMKNASENEISELAKQEIKIVISQLKAQEDMLSKQDRFNKNLQEVNNQINLFSENNQDIKRKITRHDRELENQKEIDKRHDRELENQKEINKNQEQLIYQLSNLIKRLSLKINIILLGFAIIILIFIILKFL